MQKLASKQRKALKWYLHLLSAMLHVIVCFVPLQVFGSLHGEELPYGLGMPLSGGSNHFEQNYTFQEQNLAEVMMHYWSTFARTG